MASIRKRSNGKFQASVFVGRDVNGKQMFKFITCDTEKECRKEARKIEQELDEGIFTHIENIRVTAWIEKWLELNKERLSPSTYALYKGYTKIHFKPFFEKFKLNQLNDIHIRQFMNEKQKNLSQSSVRRIMSTLRIILKDALKYKNPVRDIKLPSDNKYIPKVLTEEEMEYIHNTAKGTKDEPIILLAAWCGLRRGEIFALKWNDIDWGNGVIRVDESYCINEENKYEDKRPKSEKGLREVIIPKYLLNILDRLKKEQAEIGGRIFHNIRPDSYSRSFAKFIKKNSLPKIRFHDLRHYHASWLYARGVPDQYAAQRLGHDIKILKSIYQHLQLDKQHEVDNNIRNMFDYQKENRKSEKVHKYKIKRHVRA